MRGELHDRDRRVATGEDGSGFAVGFVADSPRGKLSRAFLIALPVVGFVLAVALLMTVLDVGAALAAMARADPDWLAAAAALALLLTLASAVRLWLILRAAGERRSLRRCWSAVMASMTLNAVTPSRGGDLVKAVFLTDNRHQIGMLIGATVLERVIDVMMLSMLALFGALSLKLHTHALVAGLVTFGCLLVLAILRFSHAIRVGGRKLESLGRATRAAFARPAYLPAVLGVACLFWLTVLCLIQCLLHSVAAAVPFGALVASMPLAILIGILPLSISGIGTRDAAMVLLLKGFAAPEGVLAAGLLYTVVGFWFLALVGLFSLGRETLRKVRASARHQRSPSPQRVER